MAKRPTGLLEDRLKEFRYKRNWTQKQLAVLVGVHPRTILRAEAGEPLSPQTLYRLEEILKREAA